MAVRITLNNGQRVVSRLSVEDVREAFQKALDRNTVLDIRGDDDSVIAVNPFQIVSFEEIDAETAEALLNGADHRHATTA